jgi:hypothetical protein
VKPAVAVFEVFDFFLDAAEFCNAMLMVVPLRSYMIARFTGAARRDGDMGAGAFIVG